MNNDSKEINHIISYWFQYLKKSFFQSLYPANRRFFSVVFLWNSFLPVSRNILNPSCFSSLKKFKLADKAGALAKSTHSSKASSLKISDLNSKQDRPSNYGLKKKKLWKIINGKVAHEWHTGCKQDSCKEVKMTKHEYNLWTLKE